MSVLAALLPARWRRLRTPVVNAYQQLALDCAWGEAALAALRIAPETGAGAWLARHAEMMQMRYGPAPDSAVARDRLAGLVAACACMCRAHAALGPCQAALRAMYAEEGGRESALERGLLFWGMLATQGARMPALLAQSRACGGPSPTAEPLPTLSDEDLGFPSPRRDHIEWSPTPTPAPSPRVCAPAGADGSAPHTPSFPRRDAFSFVE